MCACEQEGCDSIEGVVKIRILHPLNSFMLCTCQLSSANETWLFCLQAEFARLLTSIMSTTTVFSSFYFNVLNQLSCVHDESRLSGIFLTILVTFLNGCSCHGHCSR